MDNNMLYKWLVNSNVHIIGHNCDTALRKCHLIPGSSHQRVI